MRGLTDPLPGLVALTLALTSCLVDGSVGKDDNPGGGEGGATVAAEGGTEATTSAASGGTLGGGAGSGESGGSSPGSGTVTADTVAGTSGSGGPSDRPAACQIIPDDAPCAECRKTQCCEVLDFCLSHDSCACWWECHAMGEGDVSCGDRCDTDGAAFLELSTCVEAHCDVCMAEG